MATRSVDFSIGEYYHIYNRGTDKRDIFLDDADRDRFIKLLYVANGSKPFVFRDFPIGLPYVEVDKGEPIVAIGAYCLMTNHFHILVKETHENGMSRFVGKLLTSYSSYFNKKYGRSGRLFEGSFKAKHLDTDEFLKYIFSYIHLNPIKMVEPEWKEKGLSNISKARKHLGSYSSSSYLEYIGGTDRVEKKILNKDSFPDYFRGTNDFQSFLDEWLLFEKNKVT